CGRIENVVENAAVVDEIECARQSDRQITRQIENQIGLFRIADVTSTNMRIAEKGEEGHVGDIVMSPAILVPIVCDDGFGPDLDATAFNQRLRLVGRHENELASEEQCFSRDRAKL